LPKFSPLIAGVSLLLVAPPLLAQQNQICVAPDATRLGEELFLSQASNEADNAVTFEAGSIDAFVGANPRVSMSGGVLIRRGDRLAGAETADYDPTSQSLELRGKVRYEDPATSITSNSAELNYSTGRILFEGAEFQLGQGGSRGSADRIEISREGTLSLGTVRYTTCPPGSNDWLLEAADITLDTRAGVGTAKKVAIRFKGVPILYTPTLTFPLGDARKTGLLAPEIGGAGRSGNEIRVPWYWNISEKYDATLTPRLLTERGLQISTEFRYLTRRNDGLAQFEYLSDDRIFGDTRQYFLFKHRTLFDNGWRNLIDYRETSDGNYFEDLGGSLSTTSITNLNRSALFDYYTDDWSFLGRVQDYQTIDESIAEVDRPYRRLPQLYASAALPSHPLGLSYSIDGELVYFDRDVGTTGWRFNTRPKVEWDMRRPGWFLKPTIALDYTQYSLENTAPGEAEKSTRTVPISSIDIGMILERAVGSSNKRIQTLEPRILYVHVPYREQSGLPVFDTIEPDLNLVQLFRTNRFLGVDRIADTDQLSFGITTRLMDADTGKEVITATIGQALYLSEQGVTLPGQSMINSESSDYIAELRVLLYKNFSFDIGHQWANDRTGTTRSEVALQYRPGANKVLNLAYRFRRDSLEQSDVSWSWPLTQSWNFVGRFNYSLRDAQPLERFAGLEYESCCWGFRMVYRRYVSTRDGIEDSSFGIQLVLKGLTSVGDSTDRLLERGILGYSRDFE